MKLENVVGEALSGPGNRTRKGGGWCKREAESKRRRRGGRRGRGEEEAEQMSSRSADPRAGAEAATVRSAREKGRPEGVSARASLKDSFPQLSPGVSLPLCLLRLFY